MKVFYDILVKYQNYLLGLAVFLILSAVSITVSADEIALNLVNYPAVILMFVSIGLILILLYIYIDQNRISSLSKSIHEQSQFEDKHIRNTILNLTSRQKEIYELIISGKSNKDIMAELFIEQSTLKSHINQIYKKLNIKNRRELKSKAKDMG